MKDSKCVVPARFTGELRRSMRLVKAPKDMLPKEILGKARVTKSNLDEAPKEMPLKKRLSKAPTPSGTKSSLVCKNEPIPLKERCEEEETPMKKPKIVKMDAFDAMICKNNYNVVLRYAKSGLEVYHNNKKDDDTEFEIVRVLYSGKSGVGHHDFKINQFWTHVCFIAKPKNNNNNSNASPKHFLAELMYVYGSGRWDAIYCDTFEPSREPGFKHECLICTDARKTHPGHGEYKIGAPPHTRGGFSYM